MAGWGENKKEIDAVAKYSPKDITNKKDFSRELNEIDNNREISFFDRYSAKKQLVRTYMLAKQKEIDNYLDTYVNYLLAKKDVESKAIALEAQKAILNLEKEQREMMSEIGLSNTEEIANTLIKSGTLLTDKINEVNSSNMDIEIKKNTLKNIRSIWDKTNERIMGSVDTYIDELSDRERRKQGF